MKSKQAAQQESQIPVENVDDYPLDSFSELIVDQKEVRHVPDKLTPKNKRLTGGAVAKIAPLALEFLRSPSVRSLETDPNEARHTVTIQRGTQGGFTDFIEHQEN